MTLPSLPLPDVIYNVRVYRGVTGDRKLLSCNAIGEVDLWTTDDDSNRQKWQFIKLPDGSYNIRVFGGVNNGRVLLSCGGTGERVDLWTTDDGSGRQRWTLEPLAMGCFRIRVKGGVSGGRVLLSCGGDGKRVDLWTTDDNSGRQQWVLIPEDIELDRVEFNLPATVMTTQPDFVDESVVENTESNPLNKTATYTHQATTSSSFEQTHAFTFSASGTKNFGTPVFASGSVTVSASTTHTWSYATNQTRQDTRSYSLQIIVPGHWRNKVALSVKMLKLNVPYTAYGTSKLTGQTVAVPGEWTGVTAGQILHVVSGEPL
ncbi:MAG: ETX/MTX2 family pore-forming toxin [Myxococcales bacterium]|nr:ETX/MTX2 family pore-forming toxin [Myxococcales bacterium]